MHTFHTVQQPSGEYYKNKCYRKALLYSNGKSYTRVEHSWGLFYLEETKSENVDGFNFGTITYMNDLHKDDMKDRKE